MKALTLYQPWASLLALGLKHETRSWKTSYRGPIAIHAAARPTRKALFEINEPNVILAVYAALQERGLVPKCPKAATLQCFIDGNEALPLGCIVGIGELVECYKIIGICTPQLPSGEWLVTVEAAGRVRDIRITNDDLHFGDWTPGRYAWELADVKLLPDPIPVKGKQGLWNWAYPETETANGTNGRT